MYFGAMNQRYRLRDRTASEVEHSFSSDSVIGDLEITWAVGTDTKWIEQPSMPGPVIIAGIKVVFRGKLKNVAILMLPPVSLFDLCLSMKRGGNRRPIVYVGDFAAGHSQVSWVINRKSQNACKC